MSGVSSAQQTWIVDLSGTGQFTTAQAAVQAAASGDTILLRGGGNFGNAALDRSLSFVSEGPVPTLGVVPTSAGIRISFSRASIQSLSLTDVDALFEDVVVAAADSFVGSTGAMVRCTVNDGLTLQTSSFAFDACDVTGPSGWWHISLACVFMLLPLPALELEAGSTASLAGSSFTGGAGALSPGGVGCPPLGYSAAAPAVVVSSGSSLVVTTSSLQGGSEGFQQSAISVDNQGSPEAVAIDPSVVFSVPPNSFVSADVPAMRGQGALPGSAMSCVLETQPQRPAAIAASLGFGAPVPSPFGPAWIDTSNMVLLVIGITDGTGALSSSIPVPAGVQRGLSIAVQGVAGSPTLSASTPTVMQVL